MDSLNTPNNRQYWGNGELVKLLFEEFNDFVVLFTVTKHFISGSEGNKSLQLYVTKLQEEEPTSNIFFQSHESNENSQENLAVKSIRNEINESEDSGKTDTYSGESFLFVYQARWQSEFMMHYGNELSVLNPMIETQNYCLPLYFVFAKTDLGYTCVAMFVVQKETPENITSALKVLQEWNPDWQPKYWMTVLKQTGAEIYALKENFPSESLILLTFSTVCIMLFFFRKCIPTPKWLNKKTDGTIRKYSLRAFQ
jgi:hypothetical protein